MKETDPRFINLGRKAGLFFAVAVIGIAATLIFISMESGIFTKKFRIHFTVDRGVGFFEGMPVKLSGFKIGKIESLSLDENARVKVVLVINKKYQRWIRQDSRAMVGKEGLIGESVIDITVGSQNKPVIENDSSILYEKARGLDEIMEDIKPLIGEVKNILTYVNDPQGDIKQTLKNFKNLSAEFRTTREHVDKLLKSADMAAKNADKVITSLDGKVNPMMDKLSRTLDNAEKSSAALKTAIEKSAPKLPQIINKGEDTLDETNEIVRSLKQVWPISLFIDQKKESLIYGDSYE